MTSPAAEDMTAPVLVVGPSWIGDTVMASSLFRVLRDQQPDRPIDVLAPAWTDPLLARMPEIRRSHRLAAGHGQLRIAQRWRLGRSLRSEGYAQAIILPRSLKSALVPWFAGIPKRTGYLGEHRRMLLNDIREPYGENMPMVVQRYVALGLPADASRPPECPAPSLVVDEQNARAAAEALHLERDAPVLALCPGADYGPSKRWPPEHFAALARLYLSRGWRIWLFGSRNERVLTGAIAADAPGVIDLAGRTRLIDAVDLLSLADAVVSNDSGLMHAASALDRPLVALYGATPPHRAPPLNARSRSLWLGLDCSPCFQRHCPLGHTNCLRHLLPDQVDDALRELVSPSTSR